MQDNTRIFNERSTRAALRRSHVSTVKYGGLTSTLPPRRFWGAFVIKLAAVLLFASGTSYAALDGATPEGGKRVGPERTDISQLNRMNRVSRRSNIWMNFTNYGYFGNSGAGAPGATDDPCRPG